MELLSPLNKLMVALVRRLWRFRRLKGRLFTINQLLRIVHVMVTPYGPLIRVRRHDFTNRSAIFGSYGSEVADWVRSLRPDDVFIDVGANTGIFSLIADEFVSEGAIFAFEPNPSLYNDLRFNIRVNAARRIIPFNFAVSDKTTTFTLIHNPSHTGAASLRKPRDRMAGGLSPDEHVVIGVAPKELDVMLQAIRNRRVCIKIDVEGHELNVLRGLQDAGVLARTAWVIAEIDPDFMTRFGSSLTELYALMDAQGFTAEKGAGFSNHYDEMFRRRE